MNVLHPLILHTADGGVHWGRQTLSGEPAEGSLTDVDFASVRDGLLVGRTPGGAPLVYATSDGGRRWRPVELPAGVDAVFDVSFIR